MQQRLEKLMERAKGCFNSCRLIPGGFVKMGDRCGIQCGHPNALEILMHPGFPIVP
jgi:hypothetical protein